MITLIIGKDGQLGSELMNIIDDAIGTSRREKSDLHLDLRNTNSIEDTIMKVSPDVIVNAAAITDVDYCETHADEAYGVNSIAVKHIARAASVVGSYLIHISTDYVFDGSKGNYSESDIPNPINYYGLSKLMGEAFALSYDDSLVIRTSGVYGVKTNFPLYVAKTLRSGGTVTCIDSYYSPIHVRQLAFAIREIISRRLYGIIHVSGPRISRFDFATRIKERLGIDRGRIIMEGERKTLLAKRPYDSSLNNERAKRIIKYQFEDIDAGIEMLREKYEVI
ncbi:NAD(P)-dependent oxidoreductase [Thermoplasma sp. Kam2015]|uniref:SDR family oxidoreductase n=1 Tax=Thermoplasma sp. Kam2015 TaxID=2094122 RepID=UPI000D865F8C|nr:NAD(P)-dependent oxidoreductase [Thermoplasma sp. Kam2015]PYB68575.1 NAD(P)-dependent oxidoreductase [Thermoplasma sp. Kam2015]